MNNIRKRPINDIGYGFVDPAFLPPDADEYHLRNVQNRSGITYRKLTASEIEMLVRNNNTSDDWNHILVSDAFNPDLVKNCKFFGLVRIGKLEPYFLEFHNLRMPVGLYNSTLISCDFGDNVVVDNVNYMSHYIIGNEVIIANVNELATTSVAKFGNGTVKEGEQEDIRIWMEVCNENAGRKIIPFNGMLPGDAFMWAKYRDDEVMLDKFIEFTETQFDKKRGYYGKVGDRTVIKNCRIIKDAWIGSDAYIKGANKIKNVTISSSPEAYSQIGEGCELVNGIIGFGCKIFYGVKAVRFIMASHSQLKYGARLINSYLGNNSTISCCEVLNSLIFPFHEQHHNNSFLCAALVQGQSNMAAGATIGSNHNSRSADGELVAGRGFWPGLCVSLKHNSKFASFSILAKGDYPAELNIPIPFSLLSNDVHNNRLIVIPGYWFLYNLYALTRNEWKYGARDLRIDKTQRIEVNYLAPDSINEMFTAIELLCECTGAAFFTSKGDVSYTRKEAIRKGRQLLEMKDHIVEEMQITAKGFENSERKVVLLKVQRAYDIFKKMIRFYGIQKLIQHISGNTSPVKKIIQSLPFTAKRNEWMNIGGQLIPSIEFEKFRKNLQSGKVKSWDDVHGFYAFQGEKYESSVFQHAFASLREMDKFTPGDFTADLLLGLLNEGLQTEEWINREIIASRQKDYENPFRKMVYENDAEMNMVMGSMESNSFINLKKQELKEFKTAVRKIIRHIQA